MIVVKTLATLRIKGNKGKNKLVPIGSVFRGRRIKDLPEWLQEHITYFRKTVTCNTLLIKEHAETTQPNVSKGIKETEEIEEIEETEETEEIEETDSIKLKKRTSK